MLGYFYYLTVGLVLAGSHVNGDDFEKCVEMFKPENVKMKCCESMNQMSGIWEECKTDSYDCKAATCVLEKMGLMANGEINEDTARSMLDKWGKNHAEDKGMTDRVKQFCLDVQYEDYGISDETCSPIKFHLCTYINSIVVCSKWKDTEACQKIQSISKDCRKAMDDAIM